MPYNVYLKKNEDKRIREGFPWVYANEASKIEGKGKNGDVAYVFDCNNEYLGKGYINHLSKILVRIFIRDESEPTEELFESRIRKAKALREKLGYGNCCRVVFSESDNLPGLIVDKYADILCVQILTLGMKLNKDKIISALVKVFSPKGIYERSDTASREKEGLKQFKGKLYGEFDTRTEIQENGLRMTVDLENGQKTGYFLDQKENRLAVRRYCKDADVLDLFCNVGGFSVNAAKAGAKSVTAVDISTRALDEVKINAKLNGFGNVIETKCADVFDALREYKKENRKFDVVILDPPAFCKSADDVKNAYRGYKDINVLGMKLVKEGGYLVTASCTHYISIALFEKMLKEASAQSGVSARVIEIKTQSPDHASLLSADESTYLKFFVLQIV
ncbi:MAG: class I SAM-dependent rRNA methyltransferase [Clostridia bacterium]|nr:class I SAM-dependent rRNA methyltransferase [Clostridia bacterium]